MVMLSAAITFVLHYYKNNLYCYHLVYGQRICSNHSKSQPVNIGLKPLNIIRVIFPVAVTFVIHFTKNHLLNFIFSQLEKFVDLNSKVLIEDLALSPVQGHECRIQFKKFVLSLKEGEAKWTYTQTKRCR